MKWNYLKDIKNANFLEVLNFFLMHDYKFKVKGDSLFLVYKKTKIEFKNYKDLIDCYTLKEMQNEIINIISESKYQVKRHEGIRKIAQLSTLSLIILNMLLTSGFNKKDVVINDKSQESITSEEIGAILSGIDISVAEKLNTSYIENWEPFNKKLYNGIEFKPHGSEEFSIYDQYLSTYASYYNFDARKVIKLARKLTNNYTIGFEAINNTDQYDVTNDEAACLMFVSQLKRGNLTSSLEKFNLNLDYFVLEPEDEIQSLSSNVLDDGLTFSQFVGKVCDLLQVDKYYVLSVIYSEVGEDLDCKCAREYHNFGGIKDRDTSEFIKYPSVQAGIIAMCRTLKRYEQYNFDNIYNFCGMYRFGDPERYSETWINRVTWFHYKITKNKDYYFLPETRENNLKLTR